MNNNDNDKNIGREIHEAWSECFGITDTRLIKLCIKDKRTNCVHCNKLVKHNCHVSVVVKDHLTKECTKYQNKIKAKQNLVKYRSFYLILLLLFYFIFIIICK